jgi:hypothetical protein
LIAQVGPDAGKSSPNKPVVHKQHLAIKRFCLLVNTEAGVDGEADFSQVRFAFHLKAIAGAVRNAGNIQEIVEKGN